jgi:hypothetical protein
MAHRRRRTRQRVATADHAAMTPNYAMQRSSRVGTPLAGLADTAQIIGVASGAPTARRR